MKYLLLLLLLFPCSLFSQDLSGLWTGSLYNDSTQQTIKYEVAISQHADKFSGYSSTTFVVDNKEAVGIKSFKIIKQKDHFFFEDVDLLYNNYPSPPPKGVKQISSVVLEEKDDIKTLSGKFITSRTRQYGKQVTGTLQLRQIKITDSNRLITALDKLGLLHTLSFLRPVRDTGINITKVKKPADLPLKENKEITVKDPLKELAKRRIETIETVPFASDSLRLILYDNGYVDGDSVTIIINGRVALSHQRLSQQAITKTIAATADSIRIIMYAENLGSIAPNTGLLIIYDGEKRHEIRFEGDLEKNAAILLKKQR